VQLPPSRILPLNPAARSPAPRPPPGYVTTVPDADRTRWNTRYLEEEVPSEPSPFVTGCEPLLPRRGRALDVGGGAGRHALWLARRGLEVTLADVSDVALGRAGAAARAEGLRLTLLETDLEAGPFPSGPWDLVLCTYFLHRPIFADIQGALRPGGLLLFAHATRRNLERHPRPGPTHLLEDGELPSLLAGFELLRLEEGWLEAGRHEARAVARKPAGRPAPGTTEEAT
jgi:tellurite methyltransferase